MDTSVSTFDSEGALSAARAAKIIATYQVSSYRSSGVEAQRIEKSFERAFESMRQDDAISTMTVNFQWRLGMRIGSGKVVYDGEARFPLATPQFAERMIQNMIVRSIAEQFAC